MTDLSQNSDPRTMSQADRNRLYDDAHALALQLRKQAMDDALRASVAALVAIAKGALRFAKWLARGVAHGVLDRPGQLANDVLKPGRF